jgi:general secretion pathway protein G
MAALNKGRQNNNRHRGAAGFTRTSSPRGTRGQRRFLGVPRNDNRLGFTLMEVLLVLVILVVLASMAVNVFWGAREKADLNTAKAQVGLYGDAMERYRLDMKKYPSNLQELLDKPGDAAAANRWGGPYMNKAAKDPWEREYKYVSPGKHNADSYDVWSAGPDGQDGTADDIGNWENS